MTSGLQGSLMLDIAGTWLTAEDRQILRQPQVGGLILFARNIEHPRQVLDRDRLLDMVQGREAHLFDRAVDNQVSRLRRKIEVDSKNPALIQTVWGGGYMLAADVSRVRPGAN